MQADAPRVGALFERIAELERDLAPRLLDRTKVERLDFSYIEAARRWSAAVWIAAEALGAVELSEQAIERGLALASRPVFVCGAHRSGTTLLRDLLDGHPALAVIPFETGFYTHFRRQAAGGDPEGNASSIGQEWLRRLVNPNNQPPFWLLGRSDEGGSPYVELVRLFSSWRHALGPAGDRASPAALLVAFALAYAGRAAAGAAPPAMRMWVEKTPTSEQALDDIVADFPEAKFLHVVRRPEDAYSSHKALLRQGKRSARAALGALRNLARSYAIALDRPRTRPPNRYRLVRYEELAEAPAATMHGIADFLGIEPLPILSRSTVAGLPASRNSSFPEGRRGSADLLGRFERDVLALALGRDAALLGYEPVRPGSPIGRALRAVQHMLTG
ncbi:MAG TPA: sulfotransferase [Allosphingosinicella sp.]|jgi:hypothetical protein